MPFGVVALIFANKVNVAKEEDELEAAVDASRKARRWYLRGIIAAVVFNVVALIVQFGRVILSRWANP
jgi:t-SNARE complex subunit (syntaxin)